MKKKLRWSLILVILAVFAVWLEPTRIVWGWLRGEAFYDGRPTSWWKRELEQWEMINVGPTSFDFAYYRKPSWWSRWFAQSGHRRTQLNWNDDHGVFALLHGDPAAEAVLRAVATRSDGDVHFMTARILQRIEVSRKSRKKAI